MCLIRMRRKKGVSRAPVCAAPPSRSVSSPESAGSTPCRTRLLWSVSLRLSRASLRRQGSFFGRLPSQVKVKVQHRLLRTKNGAKRRFSHPSNDLHRVRALRPVRQRGTPVHPCRKKRPFLSSPRSVCFLRCVYGCKYEIPLRLSRACLGTTIILIKKG